MKNKNVRTLLSLTIMSLIIVLKVSGQSDRQEPPTALAIQVASSEPVMMEAAPMVLEPKFPQPPTFTNAVPVHPVVPVQPAPIQPVVPTQPVPVGSEPAPPSAPPALMHQKD